MARIEKTTRDDVRITVYAFFSDECEVPVSQLHDGISVIRDLEGDSLMVTELIDVFKKKYRLNIDLKVVGKYVARHPADTIGAIVDLILLIMEHENGIAEID